MKKIVLCLTIMVIIMFCQHKLSYAVDTDEEILKNHHDLVTPIYFKDTNEPVTVPKNISLNKKQFRGIYVYTNENLDFQQENTIQGFKRQYLKILNKMEEYNMNVIIFQIRPTNDAFYTSTLNPWSRYLTGKEDKSLNWDPLKWMISTTHDRGISFYAGFNAYRVSNLTELDKMIYLDTLSEKNYAKRYPDYVLKSIYIDGRYQYFLNPGVKEVQDFILNSVMEIVNHYEIDAINLENYFYPFSTTNQFDDNEQYLNNNEEELTISEWRRRNITSLIHSIKEEISLYNEKYNKTVQFGMTPYGVWDNYNQDNPEGSHTIGYTSYQNQYADTRQWIKKQYVDYVAPNIEWDFEEYSTPYADVVKWWSEVVNDTNVNLYIGHDIDDEMNNENQIIDQIRFNHKYSTIKGSLLFSYNSLENEENDKISLFFEDLKQNYWYQIAIHPSIESLSDYPPKSISRLLIKYDKRNVNLSWKPVDEAKFYLIYRFENDEEIDLNDTTKIIKIIDQKSGDKMEFIDSDIETHRIYRYFIITINETFHESTPVVFDIDLNPNEMFSTQIIIFSILSFIALSFIGFSSFKALKKS